MAPGFETGGLEAVASVLETGGSVLEVGGLDLGDVGSAGGGKFELPSDYGADMDGFRLPSDYGTDMDGFKLPDDYGGDAVETRMLNSDKPDLHDPTLEKLDEILSKPEKLQELLDQHPEVGKKIADAVDVLNDPEASDLEVKRAKHKLDSNYKGEVLEIAIKDLLAQLGLDVEDKQKMVEGESGGTKPDVIAQNNTNRPINVFGIVIRPGETLGVECKCGRKEYLSDQLKNHIPNQLSGHEGHSVLLTTSNIKDVNPELVNSVCSKYDTTLVTLNVSAAGVENAMKGAKP